jgi:hypothetical protein
MLEFFVKIIGIGAASGIVYHQNMLYIISDNSSYLYEYLLDKNLLNKIALVENSQENIPKKEKYDLEAIAKKGNKLHIIGSGSKEKRNTQFSYHIIKQKVKVNSLKKTYTQLKKQFAISDDDLNIEGLIFANNKTLLFQRGNGENSKNGIFIFDENTDTFDFKEIILPKINNTTATFTDAVFIENKIYFLATAEKSNSTYLDGEIAGSIIGVLNFENFNIEKTIKISDTKKFEGLTLYKKTNNQLEFLLCEDNDTEVLETTIYKIKI